MNKYQKIDKLGAGNTLIVILTVLLTLFLLGTYGIVHRGKNKETGQVVALKRIKIDDENEVFLCKSYKGFFFYLRFFREFLVRQLEKFRC